MLQNINGKRTYYYWITVILCVALLSITISVLAAAPIVYLSTPGLVGYYMRNESLTVQATVSNNPTSVQLYWDDIYKKNLPLLFGTTYGTTWTPSSGDFRKGVYTAYGWAMDAKIRVTATNGDGSDYDDHAGQVTLLEREYNPPYFMDYGYSDIDSTWTYTDNQNNSFISVPTDTQYGYHGKTSTYNCLAYSVENVTIWQWPLEWPSLTTADGKNYLQAYMSKGSYNGYNYSGRPGSLVYNNIRTTYQPWTTKVIYYDGGHFAVIKEYNGSGYPSVLYSKWGSAELIKSTFLHCFQGGLYGTAYYFID